MGRHLGIILIVGVLAAAPAGAGELKGSVHAVGVRDSANAVVYVDAIPGKTFPPPDEPEEIDQQDMEFVPHVLPILVGTKVNFRNSDAVLHNVFSPDKCADRFNLGSWPQDEVRSYTFEKPCMATLLCNVHPEMEAFVLALPTPYFALTDRSGSYAISDLPDGTYTVKVWHPKLKEVSREVTVAGSTSVDFEIKR